MSSRPAVVILALGALTWLSPAVARACSCLRPPPPAEARDGAHTVFEGRTFRSEALDNGMIRYDFEVTRSWKGEVGSMISVVSHESSAACGRRFTEGVSYVVYASEYQGQLRDNLCSRTRGSEEAAEDHKVLGPGTTPGGESAEPAPAGDMPTEPPRVEPTPQPTEPPPAEPGARGCSVNGDPGQGGTAMLLLTLAVAIPRRRPVGSRPRGMHP